MGVGGWEEALVGGDNQAREIGSQQREPISVPLIGDHRSIELQLQAYQFQVLRGIKRVNVWQEFYSNVLSTLFDQFHPRIG